MLSHKELQIKAREIQEQTANLVEFAIESAGQGRPLQELERHVFDSLLRIGHQLVDTFLALEGDGNLGETIHTPEGGTLHRSEEPKLRRLRTIFGEHHFPQYVYTAGKGKQIALRPVDARLQLPAGPCSYLLEEFSQLFCVEVVFGRAGGNLKTVFCDRVVGRYIRAHQSADGCRDRSWRPCFGMARRNRCRRVRSRAVNG